MEFKDKKGRLIYLEENDGTIDAYCISGNGNEDREYAGGIQFHIQNYGSDYVQDRKTAYPQIANIKEKYQRSGIGTEIIKYAKTLYDKVIFAPDTECGGNTDAIHYASEGLLFKNFCEKEGITEDVWAYQDEE